MPKPKNLNLKLFLATIFAVGRIHSIGASAANQELDYQINNSHQTIATGTIDLPDELQNQTIIAKKSGGRSGGGSFKKRSSGSKSRSSGSRSTTRSSSSSRNSTRRSYDPTYNSSPTYRDTPRQTRTYTHTGSRRSNSAPLSWFGKLLIALIVLLIVGIPIFIVLFLIFKAINNNSERSGDRVEQKVVRERDNDRVTISQLQIALSPEAEDLQQKLSSLSLNADTETDAGLVQLMRESALILLRHEPAWTHVLANSNSLNINNAETAFDKISFAERSKFSSESLSNINGNLKTTATVDDNDANYSAYVVVTLILGTADDNPLFFNIHTAMQLKETLLKLASMREDYLMKFEILWTPQRANEYLTDDELLMEYTNLIKLF